MKTFWHLFFCHQNFLFQIENLLFDFKWTVKLCDFGSATSETFNPDHSWSAQKRSQVEDEVSQF